MVRPYRKIGLAILAATLLTPALAQAPPRPSARAGTHQQVVRDPKACAQPPATAGEGENAALLKRNLSEQLAQSNGVICPPPHVDPEVHKPAPPGGTMPVIPPPGTPGGAPHSRPQ